MWSVLSFPKVTLYLLLGNINKELVIETDDEKLGLGLRLTTYKKSTILGLFLWNLVNISYSGANKLVVPQCRPLKIWADGPAAVCNKREAGKIKILSQKILN